MWKQLFLCLVVAAASCESLQYQYLDDGLGELSWYGREAPWPLAVLDDRPYSFSPDMTRIPILAVPNRDMALLSQPHISAYSPYSNLVTCQLNKFSMEAVPAVRIVLPLPLFLSGEEGFLRFPSHLNVESQGIRLSMPVGALLAPVPEPIDSPYHLLNVVYAVPAFTFREPVFPQYPTFVPVSYPRPNEVTSETDKKKTPLNPVRILEFPTKISKPAALNQPQTDEELVNRGPPEELVIPAGLVQSAQPKPLIINFINSKESPLLQSLRDEADKHRDKMAKPAVEAL